MTRPPSEKTDIKRLDAGAVALQRVARSPGDSHAPLFRRSLPACAGLLAVVIAAGSSVVAAVSHRPSEQADGEAKAATVDEEETKRNLIAPIQGVVRGPDGNPVDGAKVLILKHGTGYTGPDARPKPPELLTSTTTSEAGRFTVADIEDFDRLERWGRGPFPLLCVVQADGLATRWNALQAHPGKDLEFRLRPTGRLSGRITNDDGQPVAGAAVRVVAFLPLTELTALDQNQLTPRFMWGNSINCEHSGIDVSTTSNSNGEFVLTGIPGNHGLELAVDDSKYVTQKFYACANARHPRVLEATNGTIRTSPVELTVSAASSVRVIVVDDETGEPIRNVRVAGSPAINVKNAVTNPDGVYLYDRLEPGGRFAAYVYPPEDSDYLGVVTSLDLPEMAGSRELTVPLEHAVIATGTVRSAGTNAPVQDAWIVWQPGESTVSRSVENYVYDLRLTRFGPYLLPQAETDAEGRFRMTVPANAGHLRFVRRPRGYRMSTDLFVCRPQNGVLTSPFDIRLQPTQRMYGTILLPDGTSAPKVAISTAGNISTAGGGLSYYPIETTGNADGTYEIPDLYSNGRGDGPGEPCRVVFFRTRDRKFASMVATPRPADEQEDVEFPVLLEPSATLTGRLIDGIDKNPIAEGSVMLYRRDLKFGPEHQAYEADHDGGKGSVYTDENGRFTITGLIPGLEQHPNFNASGYIRHSTGRSLHVTPQAGEVVDLGDIELGPVDRD